MPWKLVSIRLLTSLKFVNLLNPLLKTSVYPNYILLIKNIIKKQKTVVNTVFCFFVKILFLHYYYILL